MVKKSKIRVLQITGDPVGGIRKHVHSILMGLDSKNFQQSYAWSNRSGDARFQAELEELKAHLDFAVGLPIRKKPHLSDVMNLYLLMRHVRQHQVDIVHGHGAKGGVYARMLKMLCGVKAIYTPHGGSVHPLFPKWERRIYGLIEKVLIPLTDHFIFESQYTANAYRSLVNHSPHCMDVNYNGVRLVGEQELAAPGKRLQILGSDLKIGVFAMLRAIKGQKFAIEAVRLLAEEGIPVSLHLFGEGADRDQLARMSMESQIVDRVNFHGDVADVQPYMQAMDIVLIPSLYESFGYVAIEARALGRFVIASRAGGLPEIIRDGVNGALVEPGSGLAIADAIKGYIRQELRGKYIDASEEELRQFSLDAMLARLSAIYQSVADSDRKKAERAAGNCV